MEMCEQNLVDDADRWGQWFYIKSLAIGVSYTNRKVKPLPIYAWF